MMENESGTEAGAASNSTENDSRLNSQFAANEAADVSTTAWNVKGST